MANGFANRFLFVLVRRSKHLPFGGHLPEAAIMELAEKLNRAAGFAKGVRRVGMTDDASTECAAGYAALSAERAGLFGVVTGRAEAQVIRLALLYALLDHKTEIGVVHLKAAKAVWAYCDASARLIFGDRTGNEIADTILEALRQSPDGMSRTDIYNLYKGRRQAAEIDHALSLLSKSERARATTSSTGGRPKAQWVAVGSG